MFEFSFINEAHWEGEWDGHNPWLEPQIFWDAVADVLSGENLERGPYEENLTWRTPFFDIHFEVTEKGDGIIHGLDAVVIPKHGKASHLDFRRVLGRMLVLAETIGIRLYSHELDKLLTEKDIADWQPDIEAAVLGREERAVQTAYTPVSPRPVPSSEGKAIHYARVLYYLVGALALVLLISRCMGEPEVRQTPVPTSEQAVPMQKPLATLRLDDSYTLHRSELLPAGHTRALTWVIQENGNTVLERNAENEFSYRYYALKSGSEYTVFLKAFFAGAYTQVSEPVVFTYP